MAAVNPSMSTTRLLVSSTRLDTDYSKDKAAYECISDDALIHLKSYKYSSVDKSFTSRYILKHYVRAFPS